MSTASVIHGKYLMENGFSMAMPGISMRSSKTKTPSIPPAATPHPTAKDSTASTPSSPKPRENASKKMNLNKNKTTSAYKKTMGIDSFQSPSFFYHGRCFTTNHRYALLSSQERSE